MLSIILSASIQQYKKMHFSDFLFYKTNTI